MKTDPLVYLFPTLEDTDVTTMKFEFTTVGLTFTVFALIFLAVYPASLLSMRFKSFSKIDKFIWCARIMKFFMFPVPIFTGFWYLAVDDTLQNDVVNATTKTSFIAVYIWVGFCTLDSTLAAIGKLLFGRSYNNSILVHHFVVLCAYSSSIVFYNGKGHYVAMLGLLLEMSGPLTYINWVLGKTKLDHLRIWKLIQRVSIYFWYFRTALALYIFYVFIVNWDYIWTDMPLPMTVSILLGTCVLMVLTVDWTEKESKRMYKLYRSYSRKAIDYVTTTSRRKTL